MDKEKVIAIVSRAIKNIQAEENECIKQIRYLREHRFFMESEAKVYEQRSYNKSWLIVHDALEEIDKMDEL